MRRARAWCSVRACPSSSPAAPTRRAPASPPARSRSCSPAKSRPSAREPPEANVNEAVVVLNAGSSSIKFALYEPSLDCVFRGQVESLGVAPKLSAWDAAGDALVVRLLPPAADHGTAIGAVLDWIEGHDRKFRLLGAGHRVVHGADRYASPVRVDEEVLSALGPLQSLAPLHQPHRLALAQVACFDTEFHQTQSEIARLFALPAKLTEAGIKRYGFHGLSYEYV